MFFYLLEFYILDCRIFYMIFCRWYPFVRTQFGPLDPWPPISFAQIHYLCLNFDSLRRFCLNFHIILYLIIFNITVFRPPKRFRETLSTSSTLFRWLWEVRFQIMRKAFYEISPWLPPIHYQDQPIHSLQWLSKFLHHPRRFDYSHFQFIRVYR